MIERDAFLPKEFTTFDKSAAHLESNNSSIPLILLGGGLIVAGAIMVYVFVLQQNECGIKEMRQAHYEG